MFSAEVKNAGENGTEDVFKAQTTSGGGLNQMWAGTASSTLSAMVRALPFCASYPLGFVTCCDRQNLFQLIESSSYTPQIHFWIQFKFCPCFNIRCFLCLSQ